ncbi:hypothetical protein HYC85_018527 [Camellia sinensis]|uniref:Uncharacterized protein n=1 Tax=Camellia sinensis TaxID=4442 RepID=A0A7J7GUV3_CAMSI|nr:hypothetical protein HYC85_018527 [Camellia sinensis]
MSGLAFVHENAEMLLKEKQHFLPRWFAIVFPAMVELAQETGFDVADNLNGVLSHGEELVDDYHYPPLLSYLEALSTTCDIDREVIAKYLSEDGSLFQSPSATAQAFMVTGDDKCKDYLLSLVQRCPYGVPAMYPMDEELIKLCMVNQMQQLGLAEYFNEEIEEILSEVYWTYEKHEAEMRNVNLNPQKIYKDSLAFRLLRMHGYKVTPWSFCWFVHHEDILTYIENNSGCFMSAMISVYRATDLMFSGEYELKEARSFSRKLLEKNMVPGCEEDNLVMIPNLQEVAEHELSLPWIARMDHLDHRFWIEANNVDALWVAKASFYRLSCLQNKNLMKLAVENYKFRQSIYQNELEELKRWSKERGLSDMGFGREKTTYCYFAVAASSTLPHDSVVRLLVAKSGILITVADDFFDMEGSIKELQCLTEAIQRWDGKGLIDHAKIIFDALDDLVSDTAKKHLHQEGSDITENLQDIREKLDGKTNLVLLHLNRSRQGEIEDSIAYANEILDEKKRELLKLALIDDLNDLPKPCKLLHLSCLKVFQMFFYSTNLFDSNTDLLHDIKKAIYIPPEYQIHKPVKPLLPLFPSKLEKKYSKTQSHLIRTFKYQSTRNFIGQHFTRTTSRVGYEKMVISPKFKLCFA